jgi:hypothetical protein
MQLQMDYEYEWRIGKDVEADDLCLLYGTDEGGVEAMLTGSCLRLSWVLSVTPSEYRNRTVSFLETGHKSLPTLTIHDHLPIPFDVL